MLSARPHILNTSRHIVTRRSGVQHGISKYSTSPARRPMRLAVIGSGPAGYYSAYRIMKKMPEAHVDMYESLPVPYGLVRFGVAPDHPEVKKSSETLDDVAKWPNFNFIGNVSIGDHPGHLPLKTLAENYDGLLFAYGASRDKKLGIPGEDLHGVVSARAFVGWYNGLPEYENLNPDLQSGDTAVIIGQGNVALDVARILLAPVEVLRQTDISERALEALSKSRVTDVKVIGRRGPLQAPYTIKELRELLHMPGVGFAPPPETWDDLIGVDRKQLPRQLKRIAELLEKGSKTPMSQAQKAWQLGFLRSPAEFLSKDDRNLSAVGFEQTAYTASPASLIPTDNTNTPPLSGPPALLNALRALKVHPTGSKAKIDASLAFRSVGYASEPLPGFSELGIPFDSTLGIVPNDLHGRVIAPGDGPVAALSARHVPGMYCAGWVKRGPTGVIASTMDDAFHSADIVMQDWRDEVKFNGGEEVMGGWEVVKLEVEKRGIRRVSWRDWERIDAVERERGREKGKVREKVRSVGGMLGVLDG